MQALPAQVGVTLLCGAVVLVLNGEKGETTEARGWLLLLDEGNELVRADLLSVRLTGHKRKVTIFHALVNGKNVPISMVPGGVGRIYY